MPARPRHAERLGDALKRGQGGVHVRPLPLSAKTAVPGSECPGLEVPALLDLFLLLALDEDAVV
jgi:hypothetical protein